MKKRWIYTIIISSSLVIGVTSGLLVKYFGTSENVVYDESTVKALKVDYDQVYDRVSAYSGEKDLFDVFSVADVVNYSLEKYIRCENCYSYKFGVATNSFVSQQIRGAQIKNANKYFEESVSSSPMVSCGNRVFQTERKSNVDLYAADSSSIVIEENTAKAKYSVNKKTYTSDEYINAYGKTLDQTIIYIISDKTIISSNITKENNGYIVNLGLNPDLSTYYYKLQMKSISGLDKLPVFSKVNLELSFDNNYFPTHLKISEDYVATLIMDAPTHGDLETFFFANEYVGIPGLQEALTYRKR